MKKKIILRADGNNVIGLGHVYRMLSLADILKDKFDISFVIANANDALKATIGKYTGSIIQIDQAFNYSPPAEKEISQEIPFDLAPFLTKDTIVVLDGYWFGPEYQKSVKNTGAKLVCIDDFGDGHFYADAVINHAPGMTMDNYKAETYTRFYLGLDYSILRSDFFMPFSTTKTGNNLFVCLGGSDFYNLTGEAVNQLGQLPRFGQVHVLISDFYSDTAKSYFAKLKSSFPGKIVFHNNIEAAELRQVLDICTSAIVSASSVLFECYSRGLYCFAGFYTGNQLKIYNGFTKMDLAVGLGDFCKFDFGRMGGYLNSVSNIKAAQAPLNSAENINSIFSLLC